MPLYCHCGRQAVVQVPNGPPFCMECYNGYQRNAIEGVKLSFALMNFLNDEMADMCGLPAGPRIELPQPTYIRSGPVTMNTTNNIRVEPGSQVGQINAGAIVYLNRALSNFDKAGLHELASAVQSFSQSVLEAKDLSGSAQKQVLDMLQGLIQELCRKTGDRNVSMLRLAFQNIGPLVTVSTTIAAHWEKLKAILEPWIK
jgi:hypothetical protein